MVATDSSRIILNEHESTKEVLSKIRTKDEYTYFSKITFDGDEILLSDKLNSIIGGRGSGKSVLLESINHNLTKDNQINKDKDSFLSKYKVEVFSGEQRLDRNFKFDYFSQSHVNELFQSHGVEFDQKLQDYFKEDLPLRKKTMMEIENGSILNDQRESFSSNQSTNLGNLVSINTKLIKIHDKKIRLNVFKKDKESIKRIKHNNIKKLYADFLKLVPKELKTNPKIINEILELITLIREEAKIHNNNEIVRKTFKNAVINKSIEFKNNMSDKTKEKAKVSEAIKIIFTEQSLPMRERLEVLKSLLFIHKNLELFEVVTNYDDIQDINLGKHINFIFTDQVKYESILNYFERILRLYVSKSKVDKARQGGFKGLARYYLFDIDSKDFLRDRNLEDLNLELKGLSLIIENKYVIYYKTSDTDGIVRYEDITKLSPGTQTNVVLEYIVHKPSNRPLMIDQPEDNIDNQTIYLTLKKWFEELKYNRQIIVVTHDANIAINADSENLIIASQSNYDSIENKPVFDYQYGAMEFGSNLDIASKILDGGKTAVKKRLSKYGEKES